jgi:hypothetical protein
MTIRGHSYIHGVIICACGALASAQAASVSMPVSAHAHSQRLSSDDHERSVHNEELAVARDLKTRVELVEDIGQRVRDPSNQSPESASN